MYSDPIILDGSSLFAMMNFLEKENLGIQGKEVFDDMGGAS